MYKLVVIELQNTLKRSIYVVLSWVTLLCLTSIFAFALHNQPVEGETLRAIVWALFIMALFASPSHWLHHEEREGVLDFWRCYPVAIEIVCLAKWLASVLVYGLGTLVIVPLLTLLLSVELNAQDYLVLLCSSLAFFALHFFLGAIQASLRNSGVWLNFLIFPWLVPLIIFGFHASNDTSNGLYLFLGYVFVITPLSLITSAFALKRGL